MHNQPFRVTHSHSASSHTQTHATMQIMYRLPPLPMTLVSCTYNDIQTMHFFYRSHHVYMPLFIHLCFGLIHRGEPLRHPHTSHIKITTAPSSFFYRHVRRIDPDACPHRTNSQHQPPPPPPLSPFQSPLLLSLINTRWGLATCQAPPAAAHVAFNCSSRFCNALYDSSVRFIHTHIRMSA